MKVERGAEAELEFRREKVVKKRPEKSYRHGEIDQRLRTERTETEKNLMKEARKHSVNIPEVRKTDEDSLEIQRLKGEQLRDCLEDKIEKMEKVGDNVRKLHSANIIHGDLTTRNVFVEEEEVFLIDFGLSFRSERFEDKAVDIHLMKQVLETSHPEIAEEAWKSFLEGYESGETEEVVEQLEEVEARGRYK